MNDKVKCILKVLNRLGDKKFIDEVLEIGKNPFRLNIVSLGNENAGKTICICKAGGCDGLFAEIRFLLSEIYFAEELGFIPVVEIPDHSCYHENHPVNGTNNTFEYYFEQPYSISLEEAYKSKYVLEHNFLRRDYLLKTFNFNNHYLPTDEYMEKLADLIKRNLRLNSVCKEKINGDINNILSDKKTLAVHVRGADFKKHYKNHPNMVTVDEYLAEAKKVFEGGDFEQVFLATDDLEAIEKFKNAFGDNVVFYDDVIRTDGDQTVMLSESQREDHHYKLGLEVIRDVYTLSSCDGIIAGLSNVSIFARAIKLANNSDFSFKNYIDKGIKQ